MSSNNKRKRQKAMARVVTSAHLRGDKFVCPSKKHTKRSVWPKRKPKEGQ